MSKQLRIWLFVLLGTLITSASLLAEGVITMTTSRAVGETIELEIKANGNVTIEGAQETGETDDYGRKSYTIKSQAITICGDVTTLKCSYNQLTSLNLSGCTSLTTLFCGSNQLTSLDVTGCPSLIGLGCSFNQLTSLDVSKNTALRMLSCDDNQLIGLDLSKCRDLSYVDCSENQIKEEAMSQLVASLPTYNSSNKGESGKFIVASNSAQEGNFCSKANVASARAKNWNSLKRVDWRELPYEGEEDNLQVGSGVITMTTTKAIGETIALAIKADGGIAIEGAKTPLQPDGHSAYYTLTSQTVSIRGNVTTLDCSYNQLTSLDLSKNTALTTLDCYANQIKGKAMTQLIADLPTVTSSDSEYGGSFCVVWNRAQEGNVCSVTDVAKARAKGWKVTKLIAQREDPTFINYEGEDETQEVGRGVIKMKTTKAIGETLALTIKANGRVTMEGVESYLRPDGYIAHYTLTSQELIIRGDVTEFECISEQLTNLNIVDCTSLTELNCSNNQLTSLDVSGCTVLTKLDCYRNQINGEGMTKLLNSLPDRKGMSSGTLRVVDYSTKKRDENRCSLADVATAKEKNWRVLKYLNDGNWWGSDYLGIGEGVITMTTSKAIGEKILLEVKANGDFSINGAEDTGETSNAGRKYYTTTSQTITILGDVTKLDCSYNELTSLDVSGCTALTKLECSNNQLTSLNVSGCTSLTELYCSYNQKLTSLNVSGCTALTELYCPYNQKLTSLNVSGCTALTKLNCYSNHLTSLNVSGCTALTELYCRSNQLTSLDVSSCTSLTKFICRGNQLTSLDVSSCTALTELSCWDNQLTSLDVSKNTALTTIKCYLNCIKGEAMTQLLRSLPDREGQERGMLYILYDGAKEENGPLMRIVASIATKKNWALVKVTGRDWEYYAGEDFNTIVMTTTQDQYRKGFITLAIVADGDVSIDGVYEDRIATDGSEKKYTLSGNQITIRGKVTKLHCSNNQLTSLNLFYSSILEELECAGNLLTELDLSGCESLKKLSYTNGQLNSLNLFDCVSLTELDCSKNELTSLDLSDCTSLTSLACSRNKLESLDLSACTRLKSLECYRNKIRGKAVAQLVESLPDRYRKEPGKFYLVYYSNDEYEENFCYRPAVGRANDKNWRPQKGHNNGSEDRWEDYFGVKDEGVVMMRTAQEVGSKITLTLEAKGDVAIDGVKGVPVTDGKPHQYTLLSQDVTIRGYVTKLHCSGNKLTSLDLSTTVPLVELDCSNNQLTALDVSQNAAVTSLTCYRNQIKGEAMALLIKGLPQLPLRSTHLFGIVSNAADEGNVFLKADVERVRDKGWSPMKWDEERHQYEPYAGKETETFAVTLTKEGKGTITATGADDLTAVPYGTELTIVATPTEGYELISLTAGEEDILATKKVVVTDNVTVKATFDEATFAVTLTKEGEGTISATGADDLNAVAYGTELTIVATPAAGYKLTALTANGKDILATKKVVVKGATEVKATFVDHTGVETTVTQQTQLYPNPATDHIIVEGVAPASEVTLHSLTGERLYAGRADSRGVLQIDLTPYANGVYLVCVAGETYRVVVRR